MRNFGPPTPWTSTPVISTSVATLSQWSTGTGPVPTTLEELKNNIRRQIRRINEETLAKIYDNVLVRMQRVMGRKGAWIKHFING